MAVALKQKLTIIMTIKQQKKWKMKSSLLVFLMAFFILGCSAKIQTNKFSDGSIEYNDYVNGAEIQFRMKDGKCHPDARMIG